MNPDTHEHLTLGERIAMARGMAHNLKNGKPLTQRELATLAGVSPAQISRIESNGRKSSSKTVELAEALGVSFLWLHKGTGPILDNDKNRLIEGGSRVESVEQPDEAQASFPSTALQKKLKQLEALLPVMNLSDSQIEELISEMVSKAMAMHAEKTSK